MSNEKSYYTAKETINKSKRQFTEWEKIFDNHLSNKGLIYIIYQEFLQLNSNKTTQFKNDVWQKLTQFFKGIILQLKTK